MVALLQLDKYGHRMETDRMVFFRKIMIPLLKLMGE